MPDAISSARTVIQTSSASLFQCDTDLASHSDSKVKDKEDFRKALDAGALHTSTSAFSGISLGVHESTTCLGMLPAELRILYHHKSTMVVVHKLHTCLGAFGLHAMPTLPPLSRLHTNKYTPLTCNAHHSLSHLRLSQRRALGRRTITSSKTTLIPAF